MDCMLSQLLYGIQVPFFLTEKWGWSSLSGKVKGTSGLQQLQRDNAAQRTKQGARSSATDASSQSFAEILETLKVRDHT